MKQLVHSGVISTLLITAFLAGPATMMMIADAK